MASVGQVKTEIDQILAELQIAKAGVAADDEVVLDVMETLLHGFQRICEWYEAVLAGDAAAARLRDAGKGFGELALSKMQGITFEKFRAMATVAATQLAEISETRQIAELARNLVEIPVPPFFVEAKDPFEEITGGMQVPKDGAVEVDDRPLAIGVMFSVDGKPWINPNVLKANLAYDIGLTLRVPKWPDKADKLVLDFVTTLPPNHYRMSDFVVSRPSSGDGREFVLKGQVVFPVAGSLFSEPALLQTRAAFLSSADSAYVKTTTIIGYHKLLVRISDTSRVPSLSKYRALDYRLVEIVDQIRTLNGIQEQHLSDFIEALTSVLNYAGVCAQTAVYSAKTNVHEDDFQRNLLIHLRSQLGEDVLEAPKQSGGITDIKYKSIVVELKVEKTQSDREKLYKLYENQPVQYASGSGAQLSILCVLDLSPKVNPPAPPQNSVKLLDPLVHGFAKGKCPYPVRVAAVVIDGNLQLPSSYSR